MKTSTNDDYVGSNAIRIVGQSCRAAPNWLQFLVAHHHHQHHHFFTDSKILGLRTTRKSNTTPLRMYMLVCVCVCICHSIRKKCVIDYICYSHSFFYRQNIFTTLSLYQHSYGLTHPHIHVYVCFFRYSCRPNSPTGGNQNYQLHLHTHTPSNERNRNHFTIYNLY